MEFSTSHPSSVVLRAKEFFVSTPTCWVPTLAGTNLLFVVKDVTLRDTFFHSSGQEFLLLLWLGLGRLISSGIIWLISSSEATIGLFRLKKKEGSYGWLLRRRTVETEKKAIVSRQEGKAVYGTIPCHKIPLLSHANLWGEDVGRLKTLWLLNERWKEKGFYFNISSLHTYYIFGVGKTAPISHSI